MADWTVKIVKPTYVVTFDDKPEIMKSLELTLYTGEKLLTTSRRDVTDIIKFKYPGVWNVQTPDEPAYLIIKDGTKILVKKDSLNDEEEKFRDEQKIRTDIHLDDKMLLIAMFLVVEGKRYQMFCNRGLSLNKDPEAGLLMVCSGQTHATHQKVEKAELLYIGMKFNDEKIIINKGSVKLFTNSRNFYGNFIFSETTDDEIIPRIVKKNIIS
jgi:hypothetical protein